MLTMGVNCKFLVLIVFVLLATVGKAQPPYNKANFKEDSIFIRKIFDAALTKAECYENLEYLCKQIGHRISGSPQAEKAVDYTYAVMQRSGFDSVFKQDVMVPKWVRGDVENGTVITVDYAENGFNLSYAGEEKVKIRALGGSIATPAGGITAEIIEVKDFDELARLGRSKIAGKIVFFNRPMEPKNIHTFDSYGSCVNQRWAGASEASKFGAVAVIIRSVATANDDFPHTGSMKYEDDVTKIPAAAVSTMQADKIADALRFKKVPVMFKLELSCKTEADVPSHNVIGQLNGKVKDQFIICGGHLDSWDVGEGAHDDGAGCVQSIEALRLLTLVGYKPKYTLRSVMYMNEENGLRGGKKYAELADKNKEKHLFAIESDEGGFTPRGFHIEDKNGIVSWLQQFKPLLAPYGLHDIEAGGGGADVSTLRPQGTHLLNYLPDSQRYFDYHHADSDTFDKVNKRELVLGAASVAALMYLIDKYYQPTN